MTATKPPIIIYTDGSCKGNPGPGGWAAMLSYNGHQRQLSGGEANTTNNRMEMTAIIKALEAIKTPQRTVQIFTDSQYVTRGIREWLPKWRENNFRKKDGSPVLNVDLWQQLEQVAAPYQIDWQWVRGHDGNPGNEQVDALAQQQAAYYQQQ